LFCVFLAFEVIAKYSILIHSSPHGNYNFTL
jgi:hypothetical protein